MNNSLKILEILTNPNLKDDFLHKSVLEDKEEHYDLKLATLFRRYYGAYILKEEESTIEPNKMIEKIVKTKREKRFTEDKYWSIWKEDGYFLGFVEGFFHAQEGKNQLCKIKGRTLEEDFLLTTARIYDLRQKYNIKYQIDYFKNPDIFVSRFQNLEEFRVFLRINKIERMVGRKEGMVKGMHYNIYTAIYEISKDEALKEIFKKGVLNKETGEIDKKFFNSEIPLTKNGLFAILSSFNGYGAKISKMVMNLVFDVKIVAVDRRVLRSAIILNLVLLSDFYLNKVKMRFKLEGANLKEVADRVSSLSEKYALTRTEEELNEKFENSPFLSEADFLLFMYNGGDGWNILEELAKIDSQQEICRVGKCCFDETGVCRLRRKFEYKEHSKEPSKISVLRYN
jgi:hypothetical protein